MTDRKQVDKDHYTFRSYMSKARWSSIWHQIDEVSQIKHASVLEIGPGAGVFKRVAGAYGIVVETVDVDPELRPDHLASAKDLPFAERSYDVVCAFQMLEHLPYEEALLAFGEMNRVARGHVVISLPDAASVWRLSLVIPGVGSVNLLPPKPFSRPRPHHFDGEHHWEVNKRGYPLARVVADLSAMCDLVKTYRVFENPYHRFFVFKTRPVSTTNGANKS